LKSFGSILLFATVQAACLLGPALAMAQKPGQIPQPPRGTQSDASNGTADLIVSIHGDKQAEIAQPAKVTLRTHNGEVRGTSLSEKGKAFFRGIPLGTYEVQVEAPGYSPARANATLLHPGDTQNLEVVLQPAAVGSGSAALPTPPPLSLNAQKELTAGLRALQAQKPAEAKRHLLSAAKSSPNHPDVDYLLGVLAAMNSEMETAKQYFENAATRYQHILSLVALGEIYLAEANLADAKQRLETALRVDPSSWRADQLLAAVLLKQGSYSLAIQHAEHALQLGKTQAKAARLTLAEALLQTGERQRSVQILNEFLKQDPPPEQRKAAEKMLAGNREALDPTAANSSSASQGSISLASSMFAVAPSLSAPNVSSVWANSLTQYPLWSPPNVDDAVPPADTTRSCPLTEVVGQAGQRVLEFVRNVDRFTATESLSHQSLNEFGLAVRSANISFNYLVAIQEMKPGVFDVQEFRNGSTSNEEFPEHVATLGTVAMVFVFHPNYAGDFDFQCEGKTHLDGQDVWQVHFAQKTGRAARLRSYRLGNQYFRVGLKGRAWISADTSQILRMEADLVNGVPDIRLRAEHQDVTYGPVPFQKKNIVLWLPLSAQTYLDFNGHRIHRRQDFTNYLLFWIDERQNIEAPKTTEVPQTASPGT